MYRLIKTPGLESELRGDPAKISNFVEEVLRFDAPIQGLWRRATRDTELAGTRIKEGEIIVLRFGAGNHDPAQFADPEKLDPARRNARNHLTFGTGPHFCVGNQLARAELRTSFAIFLDRMRNFRLARGEGGVNFIATYVAYGVQRLEMKFDRNHAA
jgi:cytochrome P450